MRNYLVTVVDRETGKMQQVVVQASCEHGITRRIEQAVARGELMVTSPVVCDIDERRARHIPIRHTV